MNYVVDEFDSMLTVGRRQRQYTVAASPNCGRRGGEERSRLDVVCSRDEGRRSKRTAHSTQRVQSSERAQENAQQGGERSTHRAGRAHTTEQELGEGEHRGEESFLALLGSTGT